MISLHKLVSLMLLLFSYQIYILTCLYPNFRTIGQYQADISSDIKTRNQLYSNYVSYYSSLHGKTNQAKVNGISYLKSHVDTSNVDLVIDFLNQNESLADSLDFNTNCSKLNLTSEMCVKDCNIYLNVVELMDLLTNTTYARFFQYFGYHSYSGAALSANDNGNYDMCLYSYGTYCYTPAEIGTYAIYEHGCCLPGNCTGEDAIKVLKQNKLCYQGFVDTYGLIVATFYGGDVGMYCELIPRDFDAFSIIIILIFCLFLFLVCVSSVYKQLIETEHIHVLFFKDSLDDSNSSGNYHEYDNFSNDNGSVNMKNPLIDVNNSNTSMFVSIFCIQDNWKSFVTPRKDKDINFLDGIRWWSMCWVVLGHAFFFNLYSGLTNERTIFPVDSISPARTDWDYDINDFYTTFALQGFFSVDSFFWLSGFLAFWSILRLVQKFESINGYFAVAPIAYFFRYLRLAPMMMYVTLLNWKISDQLPEGPHVISRDNYGTVCSENWWKVFGLFANLYNLNKDGASEGCMGHLWYIQCDFQMFLVLPIFVVLYHVSPKSGIFATSMAFLTCVGIRIYYGYYYHFAANMIIPGIDPIHGGVEANDSYYKPWTRMGTYWAGVLGMMMFQSTYNRFRLTKLNYVIVSGSAAFILFSITFWPYQDVVDAPSNRWGVYQNVWYYALSRPGWGVGLSLLAYGMRFGVRKTTPSKTKQNEKYVMIGKQEMLQSALSDDNDNINDSIDDNDVTYWHNYILSKYLLSAEIYQPLAKLTYTMYLVHILIYYWYISDLETSTTYSFWQVSYFFVGTLTFTFVISLVLWLLMEKPMANMAGLLMKCMFRRGGSSPSRRSGGGGVRSNAHGQRPQRMSQLSNDLSNKYEGIEKYVDITHNNNDSNGGGSGTTTLAVLAVPNGVDFSTSLMGAQANGNSNHGNNDNSIGVRGNNDTLASKYDSLPTE